MPEKINELTEPDTPPIMYRISELDAEQPTHFTFLPEIYETREAAEAALNKLDKPEDHHIIETR